MFDLTGKGALVTGATGGIGGAIAEALHAQGAKVAITGTRKERLDELAAKLGARVFVLPCDLRDRAAVAKLAEEAEKALGQVDILVNNAGATWVAPMEDYPLDGWDKVMNLNVRSVFLMSQAIGRASMIPRRCGRIVNVASIAGLAGSMDNKSIAYGTSKGAVVNFTRTLAAEWGAYGITVNAIAPGFFPSKLTRGILAEKGAGRLAAHAPLKRLGDDDDLKGAALLFASAAGKHITGQILAVDGGVSAAHGGE
jgi:gluconate 5-dehydrogenase